jgi:tRNA dimethylallyltransferase
MKQPVTALAVCGPTASGKSALGVQLAKALAGEVVNVDSVQVYQELDVGSAKIPYAERGGVPHHLLDLFPPSHQANAGEFRDTALRCLHDICARGKLPVLVGGSGMYLTMLLHGIADVPATPPAVREEVAMLSREEQYEELRKIDPIIANRLHPNDTQRVTRALEIARVTKKAPSELLADHSFGDRDVNALMVVLCRDRDELYEGINRRAHMMIDAGLIEETRGILSRHGDVPILSTLGYKQACQFLAGEFDIGSLGAEIALHTRRFAKRQMTYLRNEPRKRGWHVRPLPEEPACEVVGLSVDSVRATSRVKGFRAYDLTADELIERIRDRLTSPLLQTEVWYVKLSP